MCYMIVIFNEQFLELLKTQFTKINTPERLYWERIEPIDENLVIRTHMIPFKERWVINKYILNTKEAGACEDARCKQEHPEAICLYHVHEDQGYIEAEIVELHVSKDHDEKYYDILLNSVQQECVSMGASVLLAYDIKAKIPLYERNSFVVSGSERNGIIPFRKLINPDKLLTSADQIVH